MRKLFEQVVLDIHKTWPVYCCFISFEKTAWLWSLGAAVFVSIGCERTKMYLPDCLQRELRVGRTPRKKNIFSSLLLRSDLMICSLKSLKVLKWSNFDCSCVAGKLTVTQHRQNLLIWISKFPAKLSPRGHSNHTSDGLKRMKFQTYQGSAPHPAIGVHNTPLDHQLQKCSSCEWVPLSVNSIFIQKNSHC